MSPVNAHPTKTHTLTIQGMTCQACAARLQKVLNKKQAVHKSHVNFANETLTITLEQHIDDDELLAWVAQTGFTANFQNTTQALKAVPPYRLIGFVVISLPFWIGMMGMLLDRHTWMLPIWAQALLATMTQFGLGFTFYQKAWASLKSGVLGMDVLVSLSTSVIWLYSLYAWLIHEHVYFEAGVMILVFISFGKYLEQRTKTQSLNALDELLSLLPKTISKKNHDNWVTVAVSDIQVGDMVSAKAGDKIAVDGIITHGAGDITQAHLTGESTYLSKTVGDTVLAGSMMVDGSIVYKAQATGEQTTLGQMAQALSHAQNTKAPIARLADKVASVFVPIVAALSLITFFANLYWLGQINTALMRACAVLVIACPCALGLATPTAIMAGMRVASRHGVQFVDAAALEMTGQLTAVAFDKTGTLTQGRLSVDAFSVNVDERTFFTWVASLESHSNHPIAHALCTYAKRFDQTTQAVHTVASFAGLGIQGILTDGLVKIGNNRFAGGTPTDTQQRFINNHSNKSLVFVSLNDELIGIIALSDQLKADASLMIDKFKIQGILPIILSGDRQSVVDDIASRLDIPGMGELSPHDKLSQIKILKQTHKVAMIGDGINDALAMTHADIAIAVALATDTTKASAGVRILHTHHAMAIYDAYVIAQMTLKTIKQNLFFAFIYNVIAIPLAMIGVLNPVIASIVMALSSLSVLINALRLHRFEPISSTQPSLKQPNQPH